MDEPLPLPCPHLRVHPVQGIQSCALAQWMVRSEEPIETTPEKCKGCNRCSKPQDVNEVTIALSGIEYSDEGPGTTLHNVITWFVRQPENCGCPDRVKLMNAWGPKKCLEEKPVILGWLRESALENNVGYSEYMINAVVTTVLLYSKYTA